MKTRRQAVALLSGIIIAVALSMVPVATLWADPPKASVPPPRSMADAQSAYGHLPLSFEANQGQTDSRVKYLARGQGYTLLLTPGEAVLALRPTSPHSSASPSASPSPLNGAERDQGTMLRLQLLGATHTSTLSGVDEVPGKVNYFTGNNPEKWRTNVPTFAKVTQPQVYPGIDVVYYGNQQQLEFDFIVAPGADPHVIRLKVEGADRLEIDAHGDLLLHVSSGDIQLQYPRVYQEVEGVRAELPGHYVVTDVDEVSFQVAAYDTSRPLVIDPTLFYSTYLGGSAVEQGNGIAVDTAGNAYTTGQTQSANFPVTVGAFQPASGGGTDAFVTKLNPTGSGLVYSTYLGGSAEDGGVAIAVDAAGNAYVTGFTSSANFPVTVGAFQPASGGGKDAFVTMLNPTGSGLLYSTFLGGGDEDNGAGIAINAAGNAYVTGFTGSANFPVTVGAFQPASGGGRDAFVTMLNPTGSGLLYSTYLGGGDQDIGFGIAVDTPGNAYVAGFTVATNFPVTVGAFQPASGGGEDAFVTKLNPTGSGLIYSTYLGGSGSSDVGVGIAVDAAANAYVTGYTNSLDFPVTVGAFQTASGGSSDGFVTKLNPTGSGLLYSTYLGGSSVEQSLGIAVDAASNAYVIGLTNSANFPVTAGAPQAALGGGFDAFVTMLNPTGSGLVYSTYLGGSSEERGFAIAVDSLNNAYVTGFTDSLNFPVTVGAFQTASGGGTDAFVVKLAQVTLPSASVGKVTGGGTINVSGGIGNFGFVVQSQSSSGPIKGDLQYQNHATGSKVKSESFTSFTISGNTATFGGTCTDSGVPCTFTVNITDNGEPGKSDIFTISVNGGPIQGGTLRSGSVKVH